MFTRQLATLLSNGVPLVQSLDVLSYQAEYPNFGVVVTAMSKRLGEGHRFSEELARYPKIFPDLYISMVQIGERTGALTDALNRLCDWLEHDEGVYRKVKSALVYPAFVVLVSVILSLILFYTVMPKFVTIFLDLKIELPFLTRIMIFLTDLLRNPGAWALAGAFLFLGFNALRETWRSESGSRKIFSILLRVPVLGKLLQSASASRFAAAAAISLSTGVDVAQTLHLSARASSNPSLRYDSKRLVESILDGSSVADSMEDRPDLYPRTLISMVRGGEECGQIEDMCVRAQSFYAEELDFFVESLSAMLEPILLLGVALAVGVVLLSIFMPLYSYVGSLG